MRLLKKLQDQTIVAGGDTGDNLKLSAVPAEVGGRVNYIRRIKWKLALVLAVTVTGMAGGNIIANVSRAVRQVYLVLPDIGTIVNISGNMLTRLYRLRNAGNYPPGSLGDVTGGTSAESDGSIYEGVTVSADGMGAVTADVNVYFVCDFFDPQARDPEDFAIPAALVANAQLKITFGSLADVKFSETNATFDDFTGSLITTVETTPRDEMQLPKLTTQDTVPFTGIEPNLDAVPGMISHYGIAPTNEKTFPSGMEAAQNPSTLGSSFGGTFVISEDILPVSELFAAFNADSETDLEDSSVAQTSVTNAIPLVYPPNDKPGQHLTYEVIPAGLKPRLRFDAAPASGLTAVRRYVWANGPWLGKVRAALGIPANAKAKLKTASGKRAKKGDAAILPVKVTSA